MRNPAVRNATSRRFRQIVQDQEFASRAGHERVSAALRSIWIVRPGEPAPRFVTWLRFLASETAIKHAPDSVPGARSNTRPYRNPN
jgi:hypothetical protein